MIHDSVAIFSGGLDSTVLVHRLLRENRLPHLVSFAYGQRHTKELVYASETARKLGLRHDIIDLTNLTHLISNSALTSPKDERSREPGETQEFIDVPEGHYAEDNMKLTVVPNRNMIMISIASAIAVNNSYKNVYTGVHAGDHFVYPDCRPKFLKYVNGAVVYGNEGFGGIQKQDVGTYPTEFVRAPFLHATKADIAYQGIQLGVPFEETWSCYKGGEMHCGKCGTCVERLEAISEAEDRDRHVGGAGDYDKTAYEDSEYWRTVVKKG